MAFWTPRDLRSIDYIRQNLTERDKSLALDECLRLLPNAIKREETLTAQELELRNQLNDGPYSFSNVRALRQRNNEVQNDPNASVQDKADAYNNYQMAQSQRDSLNATYDQVVVNLASATEYVISLKQGIANLRQLGVTAPTSSTEPSGNESLSQPQQVVQGANAPIIQTVNTPAIDTTEPLPDDQAPTVIGQLATTVTLGANQFNEFVTDTQQITDDTGNDAGGEDVVTGQLNTDEEGLGSSFIEPEVFGSDTDLANDEDPNLTALERGDLEEIQSDDDNVNQDEDPNLTGLEVGDQDEIVINQQSSNQQSINQQNVGNSDTDQADDQIENGTVAPSAKSNVQGVTGATNSAQNQAGLQYGVNFSSFQDWRVRLKLAPGANYLYKAPANQRGILAPLNATDGVIFPYTPQITVNYVANYDPTNPTHSNYKIMQYQNSAVDAVQIACDFTAQDTNEANYLLATIHFFRSVTKMFYGQDQDPKRGTPPPLCYLVGLGEFQFDMHPLVVTAFTYTLPDDVDYIRAMPPTGTTGSNVNNSNQGTTSDTRLAGTGATAGGTAPNAQFQGNQGGQMGEPTYVPTRIKIQLSCMPVVSRKDISEQFSLKQYATGSLLRGSKRDGGGIW